MTINYDFIVFSGRLSESSWTLGMKAIQGEVPLDIVIPSLQTSTNPEDKDIVGILTKEGISRESSDVMELYRYLRQLTPKSNQAFGYNEVAIRNIHTRLNSLKLNQELRVQISYTERKENYIPSTYNIKLLGVFEIQPVTPPNPELDIPKKTDIDLTEDNSEDIPEKDDIHVIPKSFPPTDPEVPVYKTTNTLEKLIVFTRTLQTELDKTKKTLTLMAEKMELLEEEQVRYRELENLLQDIFERLTNLENYEKRINSLESDRHQLDKLQQTLATYFKTSNRQTQALLKEVSDEQENIKPDSSRSRF